MQNEIDLRGGFEDEAVRNIRRLRVSQDSSRGSSTDTSQSFVQRALDHLTQSGDALGLEEGQTSEFSADPLVQKTSAGATSVHTNQQYKSIPIFEAGHTVRFDPHGILQDSTGVVVSVSGDLDVNPNIDDVSAVLIAARRTVEAAQEESGEDEFGNSLLPVSVNLEGFVPTVLARFREIPQRPTVFGAGPFGDVIRVSLVWFPLQGTLRLGWLIIVTMPNLQGQWQVVIDATDGVVLLLRQLARFASAIGDVFELTGADETSSVAFPRAIKDYPVPASGELPIEWVSSGFPDDWIRDLATFGNSVNAHPDDDGDPVAGVMTEGRATFDIEVLSEPEQHVVNGFYHACYLHDLFYLLGFREQDGNFQHSNFDRGGIGDDRVDLRVYEHPVRYTASMTFPPEGTGPVMMLGTVSDSGRNTALDASVVFHEYMHGVTNRLVGGAINTQSLAAPQSLAMGEGWGDYIACTLTRQEVVGSWVTDKPGGIRSAPLDANYPGHFGLLGQAPYTKPHRIGEIWAATLLQCNRQLNGVLGQDVGWRLVLQLVVDALKISPPNPTFIDARDAILSALEAKKVAAQISDDDYAQALRGIWQAFAQFGMGVNAQSAAADLSGITADFSTPD